VAWISVRLLDDGVMERLRMRAARRGRTVEYEIREILAKAVRDPAHSAGLFQAMLDRFSEIGGVELDLQDRATPARAAELRV
jgi:plasmid stability protein